MPIFDILKKKQKTEKPKKEKEVLEKKPAEIKSEEKPKKKKVPKETKIKIEPLKSKTKISGDSWRILKEPHITEKATDLNKENKYVFRVYSESNKKEIKKIISALYNVDVLSVRIINIPKKSRRLGKTSGWRKGYKKAVITTKKGQKIELLPR